MALSYESCVAAATESARNNQGHDYGWNTWVLVVCCPCLNRACLNRQQQQPLDDPPAYTPANVLRYGIPPYFRGVQISPFLYCFLL